MSAHFITVIIRSFEIVGFDTLDIVRLLYESKYI